MDGNNSLNVIATDVGLVKKVKKDQYHVEIAKHDKCNGCKACAFGKNGKVTLRAISLIDCNVGDRVAIAVKRKQNATVAYLTMFCLPLALMLISAFIAHFTVGGDLTVAIAVLIGFGVGMICSYFANKVVESKAKKRGEFPTIIKRI